MMGTLDDIDIDSVPSDRRAFSLTSYNTLPSNNRQRRTHRRPRNTSSPFRAPV